LRISSKVGHQSEAFLVLEDMIPRHAVFFAPNSTKMILKED
jgi:hypothetical protein